MTHIEPLFACQPGQRHPGSLVYHLQEVRRGRTLNITVSFHRSDITSPPLATLLYVKCYITTILPSGAEYLSFNLPSNLSTI